MEQSSELVVGVLGRGVVPPDEVGLAADDLGLTRGDGCFDAMRLVVDAHGSTLDLAEPHLARFARSAALMELPPIDVPAWQELIAEAVCAWRRPGAAVVKVMWTRGPEFNPGPPTGIVLVGPGPESGVPLRVATLDTGRASDAFTDKPWLLGGVKTLSYAVNVAVKREATRLGVDEVCFASSDGYLLEGPTSGLLMARGGVLYTTPVDGTGILASVTVDAIRHGADAEGVRVEERLLTASDVAHAEGTWLVSAVRGVCPVVELDGVELPQDAALTERLTCWAGFGPREA